MNEKNRLYPIAEMFDSCQGEGQHVGVRMFFIRTAGCTVGKPFPKARYQKLPHCEFKCEGGDPDMGHGLTCEYVKSVNSQLPIYTEKCTTYDGRNFECDTDYRVKERLSPDDIIARIPKEVEHVCLTGGEPLMHNLLPLVTTINRAFGKEMKIHIETSGTILLSKAIPDESVANFIWIAVSPKGGVLPEMITRADEVKLLIDEKFNIEAVPLSILEHPKVYLQPINHEFKLNDKNIKRCIELQQFHPNWRISIQLHKVLNVR